MAAALAPRGAAPGPAPYSPAHSAPDTDGRPTLLVTTVDIGEGRQGRVEVRAGDDPVDVARAFCARHGLPEAIVLPLAQHLEDNLAESLAGAGDEYSEEEVDEVGGRCAAVRLGVGWACGMCCDWCLAHLFGRPTCRPCTAAYSRLPTQHWLRRSAALRRTRCGPPRRATRPPRLRRPATLQQPTQARQPERAPAYTWSRQQRAAPAAPAAARRRRAAAGRRRGSTTLLLLPTRQRMHRRHRQSRSRP